MLIIPMTGKISWKNPPLLTMLLIIANCFVFFWIQSDDGVKYEKAAEFYAESGLGEIEITRYLDYLKSNGQVNKLRLNIQDGKPDPKILAYLHLRMQGDGEFIAKLEDDEIITPQDPVYSGWKSLKKKYEEMLSVTSVMKYGYKPAYSSLRTAFTYMFFHGNFIHLLGNMIFLWLAGCMLELGGNRAVYVLEYLLTGLISAGLYGLIYRDSAAPLVGASGAIAGLIGAFTVMYGRMKIKVFYSLGFYFNYARVTAIALLPVWIGNEFLQLFFGGESNVAYVAHIGGLISGGALGLVQVKLLGGVKKGAINEEDRRERMSSLVEKGLQRFAELDLTGARQCMMEILEDDPQNLTVLTHLFNIDKVSPASEDFDTTTERLLTRLHEDPNDHETLLAIFQEYSRLCQRPGLSPHLYARLSSTFSHYGHVEDSAKIMAHLLRNSPQFPLVPTALLNLSRAYQRMGLANRAEKCIKVLCRNYPESAETQVAQKLLEEMI